MESVIQSAPDTVPDLSMVANDGHTVRTASDEWLSWREKAGYRAIGTDRNRWQNHVATADFFDKPLVEVTTGDARVWLDRQVIKPNASNWRPAGKLSRGTSVNCLNLVRSFFSWCFQRGWIDANPFRDLKIAKTMGARSDDAWTVLTLPEQHMVLSKMPTPERWIAQFAIGAGLRQGEQWALHIEDLHVDGEDPYAVIKYGYHGLPPKNGKPRRVPIFGMALDAIGEWLEALPGYAPANDRGLVFPTKRGKGRRRGRLPETWKPALKAAGIDRRCRWHDLRHTCASSLVGGVWGRRWSLEEVKEMLGHSNIGVTQRYAHFSIDVLMNAARDTMGPRVAA